MQDLPTRAWAIEELDFDDWEEGAIHIVDAYADGTLKTEQEFRDSLPCQCEACYQPHSSDCSVHNGDDAGPCDCRVVEKPKRICTVCGGHARYVVTWLLPNARTNPASSGYRRDNISYCSDRTTNRCEEHKNHQRFPERGFEWCATRDTEWKRPVDAALGDSQ